MSRTIASSILRKLSACASARLLELDLVELGDAVDQLGDVARRSCSAISFLGGRRVLDDVVQDRRDDRLGIEVQVGEDVGDGDRMRDVRLAERRFWPSCAAWRANS